MSNKQFSQKEQEVLSTYFLNKMSNHLKPIPLHAGKFFDGELEIDVALPFRRIFDFEFEYKDVIKKNILSKLVKIQVTIFESYIISSIAIQ